MMMNKILLTILFLCLTFLSTCSSSKAVKKAAEGTAAGMEDGVKSGTESLELATKDDLTDAELTQVKKVLEELKDIPFDFDSYTIPTQGLEIIKKDVAILNQMLSERGKYIRITIEGHTDERGSGEYNLALGERRAKTVKEYLLTVGFIEASLKIISYGEEMPKVDESSVEGWAANRRVHLVVE